MKNYKIKQNYNHRKEYVQLDKTDLDSSDEFQKEVYQYARSLLNEHKLKTILDIGTGSGYKLVNNFRDKKFVGLDLEPNLSFLKKKYPLFDWRLSDFNKPPEGKFDLIICSDVIEHLLNPDELLEFIKKIDFEFLVLSTPERSVIQELQRSFGWDVKESGPPCNVHHIREWSQEELKMYIESNGFVVEEHFMCPQQKECQVVLARIK